MDAEDVREQQQIKSAIVASLAGDLPRLYIAEGTKRAKHALRPVVVTKYEYNQARVRDFRVSRPDTKTAPVEYGQDVNMSDFEIYPSAFTRDYCKQAFESGTLKFLHDRLWSFEFIRCIDINSLGVGDDGFIELCKGLDKCPVETLVLTSNNLSDKGMLEFAKIWRSMMRLRYLYLTDNNFTDVAMESMFHTTRYSPTLKHINLTQNKIGVRTALFIGMMFLEERVAQLDELVFGIKIGSLFNGDNFLKVLVACLTAPRARGITRLDIPDFGIGDSGVLSIASLLVSSTTIQELQISRNFISAKSRSVLYKALIANRSLQTFKYFYCGFSYYEEARIKRFKYINYRGVDAPVANVITEYKPPRAVTRAGKRSSQAVGSRSRLAWSEIVDIAYILSAHLYECCDYAKKVMAGISTQDKPPPPGKDDNKMFKTSARGELTVQQQVSMYGKRSLKATPLRDEFANATYAFSRPNVLSYQKSLDILQEFLKFSYKFGSFMVPIGAGSTESDDNSSTSEIYNTFSVEKKSMYDYEVERSSLYSSVTGDPIEVFKSVNLEIRIKEKWLEYLSTLHIAMNLNLIAPSALSALLEDTDGSSNFVPAGQPSEKLIKYNEIYERRVCLLNDQRENLNEVVKFINVNSLINLFDPSESITIQDKPTKGATIFSGNSSQLSLFSGKVSDSNSRKSTAKGRRTTAGSSRGANDSIISGGNTTPIPKQPTGYEVFWENKDNLFLESGLDEDIELVAMALEDYSSAVTECITACELLAAQSVRESFDLNADPVKALPFYQNLGFPIYYFYQCLLEPPKKDISQRDELESIAGLSNLGGGSVISSTLSVQLKAKRRMTRKSKSKNGKRFGISTQATTFLNNIELQDDSLSLHTTGEPDLGDAEAMSTVSLHSKSDLESIFDIGGSSMLTESSDARDLKPAEVAADDSHISSHVQKQNSTSTLSISPRQSLLPPLISGFLFGSNSKK